MFFIIVLGVKSDINPKHEQKFIVKKDVRTKILYKPQLNITQGFSTEKRLARRRRGIIKPKRKS
jgi:hypothetical protein